MAHNKQLLPTSISLPVLAVSDFEKYEGMLVTFPQDLVISEYFNFDRFGEIVLTSSRHLTPTALYEPGSPEQAAAALAYTLDRITLDDGRSCKIRTQPSTQMVSLLIWIIFSAVET